jgi:hypothetical protein
MAAQLVPGARGSGVVAGGKAALRLVGLADLADVIVDLAGLGDRKSVRRFADEAVRQVGAQPHEFSELDREHLESGHELLQKVLGDQAARAQASAAQRRGFLVAAVQGGPALYEFFNTSAQGLPRRVAGWGDDEINYFEALLRSVCQAVAEWVTRNRSVFQETLTAALGVTLEELSALRTTSAEIRTGIEAIASRIGVTPPTNDVLAYREIIRSIAPERLLDREAECRLVTEFARGDQNRWLGWFGPPLTGKTGLMAAIATIGIPGVDIVPFFVVRNQEGENDRRAFLSRTLPYLAILSGQSQAPAPTDPVHGRTVFTAYLRSASEAVLRRGRRLLLLIDGLDEDPALAVDVGFPSIAGLLPQHLPDGVN